MRKDKIPSHRGMRYALRFLKQVRVPGLRKDVETLEANVNAGRMRKSDRCIAEFLVWVGLAYDAGRKAARRSP